MAVDTITIKRSPDLTGAEVRARIGRVYTLLLDLARREEERQTTDGAETSNREPPATGDAHAGAWDANVEVTVMCKTQTARLHRPDGADLDTNARGVSSC